MRRAIETVPKDGRVVVLEDDTSGTFEHAHWSAEARAWVTENGELSKITPKYWHATKRDEYLVREGDEFNLSEALQALHEFKTGGPAESREGRLLRFSSARAPAQRAPTADDAFAELRQAAQTEAQHARPTRRQFDEEFAILRQTAKTDVTRGKPAGRRIAVSSIVAAMVAVSLVGLYFRAELAAYVTQYTSEPGTGSDLQKADSSARDPALQQQAEIDRARSQITGSDAAQLKKPVAEQQSLQQERDRAEALAGELANARREVETQTALASKLGNEATQLKQAADSAIADLLQSLQKEHDRAEALVGDLAKARRDIEAQATLASKSKSGNEAARAKQAAENATAELRQSLQKEHDRAEALAGELTAARTTIYAFEAQTRKTNDQAAGLKAAESATVELRQSLQTERDRAEALAGDLAKAQREIETQVALSSKTADEAKQLNQLKQAAENATAELRQSLQKEHDKAEVLASELTAARTAISSYEAQTRKTNDQAADLKAAESATVELRQSLQKERDRAEALAGDLAKAQREIETQVALSTKTADVATQLEQLKQAAESATAELRQSQQKEHAKAEALASELTAARATISLYEAQTRKTSDQAADLKQAAESAALASQKPLQQERERAARLEQELAAAQRDNEKQIALASKTADEAAQRTKAAESATVELRQSMQKEHDRAEALASEMATARTTISAYEAQARKAGEQAADVKQAAESAALESQKPLQQERERAARLEQELAASRRDNEKQIAMASKTADEATQRTKAAESATVELRQSMQKEHDRAEALAGELAKAKREIETQAALSTKTRDEVAQLKQLKQAAESVTAELRQSLKERDRAEAPVQKQPPAGASIAAERATNNQIAEVKQAAEAAATEPPTAAAGNPEAARLLARASALVAQGNIGAARIVLERAAEMGSVQASFMLAETYDPLVLSTWRTYGTRGDATKARELYAKAYAGGILEAKNRSDALR